MPRLLLASASPARLATLRRAGVDPLVRVSGVDEPAELRTASARAGELSPADEALVLARAKAQSVAVARAEAHSAGSASGPAPQERFVILGCDSVLEFAGRSWGKPGTPDKARERWHMLSGKSGILHTGHWLIDEATQKQVGGSSATTVHFAAVSDAEIEQYISRGEPLEVAGGFTIDGFGGWFIAGIEGDHHGVVGVSLPLVRNLLADLGRKITDFWQ